mmetsp:Transcript_75147/g.218172  ORF Transcript_75147/g.218172 Transcript_75147/m.218172 type:complete len:107 (-) Transcript_75147:363-683(-)
MSRSSARPTTLNFVTMLHNGSAAASSSIIEDTGCQSSDHGGFSGIDVSHHSHSNVPRRKGFSKTVASIMFFQASMKVNSIVMTVRSVCIVLPLLCQLRQGHGGRIK